MHKGMIHLNTLNTLQTLTGTVITVVVLTKTQRSFVI